MKKNSGGLKNIARRISLVRMDPLRWLIVVGFPLMIALGGLIVLGLVQHNNVMREMMAERDTRTARVIADMISEEFEECKPEIAKPLDCLSEIDIAKLAASSEKKKTASAMIRAGGSSGCRRFSTRGERPSRPPVPAAGRLSCAAHGLLLSSLRTPMSSAARPAIPGYPDSRARRGRERSMPRPWRSRGVASRTRMRSPMAVRWARR